MEIAILSALCRVLGRSFLLCDVIADLKRTEIDYNIEPFLSLRLLLQSVSHRKAPPLFVIVHGWTTNTFLRSSNNHNNNNQGHCKMKKRSEQQSTQLYDLPRTFPTTTSHPVFGCQQQPQLSHIEYIPLSGPFNPSNLPPLRCESEDDAKQKRPLIAFPFIFSLSVSLDDCFVQLDDSSSM